MAGGKGIAAGIIVVIVIIALGALLLTQKPSQSTTSVLSAPGQSYASVLLTDPPQVPVGTSALVVDYSSIAVHSTSSGWITSSTSGNVDLLALINTTQVLANLNVSTNTTIDIARFTVSNATITINGTTYNVTVPSGQLTVKLTPARVNGTASVLVQLSPTVVTIFTNTTPVFVLVPSARAVVTGNATLRTPPGVGAKEHIQVREKAELEAVTPNITITSASLVQANGTTSLSITVKDNSNASVMLQHIAVRGNESVSVNASIVDRVTNTIINRTDAYLASIRNATLCLNVSERGSIEGSSSEKNRGDRKGITVNTSVNATLNGTIGFCKGAEASKYANVSEAERGSDEIGSLSGSESINVFVRGSIANGTVNSTAFRTALVQKVRESIAAHLNNSESSQEDNRALLFIISSNGTLQLPETEDQFRGPIGYNLSAGQSHTFTFSGPISLANGKLEISLIAGGNYTIGVQGQRDTRASVNVTAT